MTSRRRPMRRRRRCSVDSCGRRSGRTTHLETFLRGLLHDLQRRCFVLRDRLSAASADPDVSGYALSAYRTVETIRRDAAQLLADPSLALPALLPNYLQLYKRWQ